MPKAQHAQQPQIQLHKPMKKTTTSLLTAALAGTLSLATTTETRAITITLDPTTLNRLTDDQGDDSEDPQVNLTTFSTWDNAGQAQKSTLLYTSAQDFIDAMNSQLSAGLQNKGYIITSATLQVGADAPASNGDSYQDAANVYVLDTDMTDYVSAQASFDEKSTGTGWTSGEFSNADYGDSASIGTGVITTTDIPNNRGYTTFTLTDTVQSWVDGNLADTLVFAPENGVAFFNSETNIANVEWTLTFTAVPEPSSTALLGLGLSSLLLRRRRA
jgi:hypothetical protein